jgi:hypothetical protein
MGPRLTQISSAAMESCTKISSMFSNENRVWNKVVFPGGSRFANLIEEANTGNNESTLGSNLMYGPIGAVPFAGTG